MTAVRDGSETTLVVVAFNHERFLPDLLSSIDSQTRAPARVLLCDDSSSDDSRRLLTDWSRGSQIPSELMFNDSNQGLTRTLNLALARVATPLYAVIAADDVMEPTRVEVQASLLTAEGHTFVYSDSTVIDESGAMVQPSFVETFLGPHVEPTNTFASLIERGNWIPACSVMIRATAAREAGGYDESLFFEDYDMWLRLARAGTFGHVATPQTRYRRVGTSMTSTRINDDSDEWQWAKVRIRAKHFGRDACTDRIIANTIRPWLVTLAARGHARRDLAPLMRKVFLAAPGASTLLWAAVSSFPIPRLLRGVAAHRRA